MNAEVERYFALKPHPLPEILPEWRPFFDGCRKSELLVEKCENCGRLQFYPRGQCIKCGGAIAQFGCTGAGTIYSVTTIRISRDPAFSQILPYHVGVIEIDEGVRMTGNIIAPTPEIGDRVTAAFGELEGDSGVWAAVWVAGT